jgi:apolipoprotein N-acyltransferase
MGAAFALLSGALLAFSFPKFGHPTVAFVALTPLYVALSGWTGRAHQFRGVSARRGFMLGLMTGVVHYTGTVYWTSDTVATFGGLPWLVAIPVAFLLVFYGGRGAAGAGCGTGRGCRGSARRSCAPGDR